MTNLDIYGTNNVDELAQMFAKEIKARDADVDEVIAKYMAALWLGQSLNTVATRYSKFRAAIRGSRSKAAKEAYKRLFFSPFLSIVVNERRQDNARERKENRDDFAIEDFFKTIDFVKEQIEKKNFHRSTRQSVEQVEAYWLAVYLGLVTGRRFTEILKTMDIKKHGKKVTIMGLLKKGDSPENLENAILLDDYHHVKKALKRLREIFPTDDFTNDDVNKKFSHTFNRYMKKHILHTDKYTFHHLRKMYAQASWERYGNKEEDNQKDFFARVLGQVTDIDAVDHYLIFKTKKRVEGTAVKEKENEEASNEKEN